MDVHDFMARSSEALILTDGQGKITAINKAWVDMCGYTADEVGGCEVSCFWLFSHF